jgi:hypothetical protein
MSAGIGVLDARHTVKAVSGSDAAPARKLTEWSRDV